MKIQKRENDDCFENKRNKNHNSEIVSSSDENSYQSKIEADESLPAFLIHEKIFKFTDKESTSNYDYFQPSDEKSFDFEIEDDKSHLDKVDFANCGFVNKTSLLENTQDQESDKKFACETGVENKSIDKYPQSWLDSKQISSLHEHSTLSNLAIAGNKTNSQEWKFISTSPINHKSNLNWSSNSIKPNNPLSNDSFSTPNNEILIEDLLQNSQMFLSDDAEDLSDKYDFKFD